MKIVIDIPNSLYANLKKIQNGSIACKRILELVRNGTPYEPRPHGEWIEESSEIGALGIKYTWIRCNRCGWDNSLVIPKSFCPNCGADMREEAENEE